MRINMHSAATPRPPRGLLDLWCHMLASEYLVEPKHAARWVHGVDTRQFVVEFLQSKGWQVRAYTTPAVENQTPYSHGFVVEDSCEHFVAWKLSQS